MLLQVPLGRGRKPGVMRRLSIIALSFAILMQPSVGALRAGPASVGADYLTALTWRSIGPFRGGRALAVTGVPGEPEHFYFGAVDGGVWESLNAGRTWTPIFDSVKVGSIGAIAVAPSDPRTIYVGTGEADMRSDIASGDGVYRSSDGGKTWQHCGLDETRQIGSIAIDPRDPNVAYVAALGRPYAPNPERGVFKTTDGGKSWTKVLHKDDDTGAIDLILDPGNPDVVYASLWQTRRPPWNVYPPSNGPGGGLYKSIDAGTTWTQLKTGLPADVGHIGIAISAAISSECTRSSIPMRSTAAFIVRTIRAQRGCAPTPSAEFGSAAGTSAGSPPIRRTTASSTS